ncbi:MAG: fatty acid desaturase [Alphaproteobacteria bacterium]
MKSADDKRLIGDVLKQYRTTSNWPGLLLVALDGSIYCALFIAACLVPFWWAKIVLGVAIGIFAGRMFQLAHTASHGALLTRAYRRWRRPLGVFCFLPAWTPEWAWDVGHNRVHHVNVQRIEVDNTWVPMSPQEFLAAPKWRQWLERAYRTVPGFGLYYMIDSWLLGMLRTSLTRLEDPRIRSDFLWIMAFIALQVGLALWLGDAPVLNIICAVLLPQFVWSWIMGMVVYFHHTHEGAVWYRDQDEGRPSLMEAQWQHSRNVTLPMRLDVLMHSVMVHVVHHLAPMVPCYKQAAATRALEQALDVEIPTHRIGWKRAFEIARHCKCWDYDSMQWVPFPDPVAEPDTGKVAEAVTEK